VSTDEWDLDRDCDLLRAYITVQMAGVLQPGTWRLIETIQASPAMQPYLLSSRLWSPASQHAERLTMPCYLPGEPATTWHSMQAGTRWRDGRTLFKMHILVPGRREA